MSTTKETVTMPKATTSDERLIGRVKWFNNKAGYGFVTVTDGPRSGTDFFAHHSAIGVANQQYKYLVQGEYVEFSVATTQNSNHEFQASNISGINGGKLMCETRNELKVSRSVYKKEKEQEQPSAESVKLPRQQKAPKAQKNEVKDAEQKEWTLVKGNKNTQTEKPATNSGRGRGRPRTTQPTK